jgi:hypothetical protein
VRDSIEHNQQGRTSADNAQATALWFADAAHLRFWSMLVGPCMSSISARCVARILLLCALQIRPSHAQEAIDQPDLDGHYRFDITSRTLVTLPVLGDTQVVTKQINLSVIRKTGTGYVGTHKACSLDAISTRSIVYTEIPQAFVDALPHQTWVPELSRSGDHWKIHIEMPRLAIGYVATSAAVGVPQEASDPRVFDWDGDGHIAATVNLHVPVFGIVEIYTAQRAQSILDGTIGANGRIEGDALLAILEQRTLGASNSLFAANPKIRPHPDPSPFRMERVSADTTCDSLPAADLSQR